MTHFPEPDRLARLLRTRGAAPEMPADRDLAMRRQIQTSFARSRRGGWRVNVRWINAQRIGAVAAVLVVAIAAWRFAEPARPGFDLDGNGRVDIVDAFTLELQAETMTERRLDLDGNGEINAADAQALGRRVVRLTEVAG